MLVQSATALALLVSFAVALPNVLEVRATCQADNCYRAVCIAFTKSPVS
jgi:hypothetical protein